MDLDFNNLFFSISGLKYLEDGLLGLEKLRMIKILLV